MTGISRLALSNLISEYSPVDLSIKCDYSGIVGVTKSELYDYFGGRIRSIVSKTGRNEKSILEEMKTLYDGFQFTCKNEQLYNPCSVITYLNSEATEIDYFSASGGSSFLEAKMKEFPLEALNVIRLYDTRKLNCNVKKLRTMGMARTEIAARIDFDEKSVGTLQIFLFQNGILSINDCPDVNDDSDEKMGHRFHRTYSMRFSNLEVQEYYFSHISKAIFQMSSPSDLQKIAKSVRNALDSYQWDEFIRELQNYYSQVAYVFYRENTKNLKNPEKGFQIILNSLMIIAGYHNSAMEDLTSYGLADVVVCSKTTTNIFETKREDNKENSLVQCRDKYMPKFLHLKKPIVCVGLRFSQNGHIETWGIVEFSKDGEIVDEHGPMKLSDDFGETSQTSGQEHEDFLELEQVEKITECVISYKKKKPKCPVEPEQIVKFLKEIRKTIDKLTFANAITTDTKMLCEILNETKAFLKVPAHKGAITRFCNEILGKKL